MKNDRFRQCFNYKLRGLFIPSLFFIGIFIVARFGLPLLVDLLASETASITFTFSGNYGQLSLLSLTYLFSLSIFLFVGGVASFREEFNHLLAMNNTRMNQFWAAQLAQVTVITGMALLSAVFGVIEQILDSTLKGQSALAEFGWLYETGGAAAFVGQWLSGLALFWAIFIVSYAFGEMAGTLAYRIGRAFILPFWICFGLMFVLIPIMATSSTRFNLFLSWYLGGNAENIFLGAAGNILLTAIIYKAISLLAIRKAPQSTVN